MPIHAYPGTLGATKYFGKTPISHNASKVTSGTFDAARVPLRIGTLNFIGTISIGSFKSPSTLPSGIAFSQRGHLWHTDGDGARIYQIGTLGLRAGTNSRIGTTRIGSVRSPFNLPSGIAFSQRGHLWHTDSNSDYTYQIGTLGLRAGTNSRIGTTRIGSVKNPSTLSQQIAFSQRGHLWHTDVTSDYIYQIGTLGLRAGTNSRIGTTQIGSVRSPFNLPSGIAFSQRGHLWHTDGNTDCIYQIGTLGLRAGTNSRIGTTQIGSAKTAIPVSDQITFSQRGHLWKTDSATDYIYKIGTPGFSNRRGINVEIPPPQGQSFVTIGCRLNAGVAASASVALTQSRTGTVASLLNPAAGGNVDLTLSGAISSAQGTWRLRDVGGTPTVILSWREWQMLR